ncbi:probable G-protein coupled receptor Mth-like 10 isoform X2 [Anoplolepis gracilipes]|uniref:probable G-protein coupled receptor Mth-like 10 isoform X2 n=1 Tax=Anoplolepis gracilipes TaxID=354296 RepID=UPI003B9F640D
MMCGNNLLLWYCIFLIIVLSSELRANSEVTSDEKESDSSTVRYELDGNTIRKYDDKQNLYTLRAHSTKNHKDIQMSMEFPTNSTDADDKKNPVSREIHINMDTTNVKNDSMSHDFFKNRDDIENNLVSHEKCDNITCIRLCCPLAFFKYYAFLGSYFWLNVFNFDIWRTFRQFRPLETNAKRQEKKKLIMYSLYAYGGPFILVIFCGIMEFVPGLPKNLTRPEFDIGECWFHDGMANLLYFYVIILISVISNVCLSICTARKIAHYEKDDTYHLKNSESGRYNDNKQWFKLTVKLTKVLFIINCIKSYVLIISAMYEDKALTIWYSFVALDFIQHFYIFIIFVCKKNVKQLLLKQFGY